MRTSKQQVQNGKPDNELAGDICAKFTKKNVEFGNKMKISCYFKLCNFKLRLELICSILDEVVARTDCWW